MIHQRMHYGQLDIKTCPHLGNRVKDSLFRRDVSGGRDGAPLSPGVGHNLRTESESLLVHSECLRAKSNDTAIAVRQKGLSLFLLMIWIF